MTDSCFLRRPRPKQDQENPRLHARVARDVLEWVESRPEGASAYLERLVREDQKIHGDVAKAPRPSQKMRLQRYRAD